MIPVTGVMGRKMTWTHKSSWMEWNKTGEFSLFFFPLKWVPWMLCPTHLAEYSCPNLTGIKSETQSFWTSASPVCPLYVDHCSWSLPCWPSTTQCFVPDFPENWKFLNSYNSSNINSKTKKNTWELISLSRNVVTNGSLSMQTSQHERTPKKFHDAIIQENILVEGGVKAYEPAPSCSIDSVSLCFM